jgi:outer membrane protein
MKLTRLLVLVLILLPFRSYAQDPVIEKYVEEGLRNNLALKRKQLSFRKSMEALSEARGMFMPSIGIEARYSRAGGGRMIEFPVGDIMNPVYSTLNQLLQASGMPTRDFPVLENEIIPFLREEEQETKIRLVQPLFEPAIYYNYRIRSNLVESKEAEREAYKRQLVEDIKRAYFNYLQSLRILELLEETRPLLEENLRVSNSLVENGKATEEVILRARVELSRHNQDVTEAKKNYELTASYFNFLLNRDQDHPIREPSSELEVVDHYHKLVNFFRRVTGDGESPERKNIVKAKITGDSLGQSPDASGNIAGIAQRREELRGLKYAIMAAQNRIGLSTSEYLPSVFFAFDYGIQGEEYRFSGDDDFWMGSLVMEWNLFDGFQRKSRRDLAQLEKRMYQAELEETRERIVMQVKEAFKNLKVAMKAIERSRNMVESARKSFKIVKRKYHNGISPQIEYLDARTTLTRAEIENIIAVYDFHIKCAEFERAAAI